jgi:hypothetical protein
MEHYEGGRKTRHASFAPEWYKEWVEYSKDLQPVVLIDTNSLV